MVLEKLYKRKPLLLPMPPHAISHPPEWNYEATVAQVESIIAQIETGELELADVFEQFAAAVESLRQCESFLAERQQQVDLLIETLEDKPESL